MDSSERQPDVLQGLKDVRIHILRRGLRIMVPEYVDCLGSRPLTAGVWKTHLSLVNFYKALLPQDNSVVSAKSVVHGKSVRSSQAPLSQVCCLW